MNKTEEMVEIYGEMREREGRQEGQLATIEQLVRTGVAWSTIEAATGIDEETFDRLKHRFDSADDVHTGRTTVPVRPPAGVCSGPGSDARAATCHAP